MSLINPNSVILELSESKGSQTEGQNGSYNVIFKEPIMINPGDEITIQQAIIDTNDPQGSIRVNKDTTITLTYGFYVVCPNQNVCNNKFFYQFRDKTQRTKASKNYEAPININYTSSSNYTETQLSFGNSVQYWILHEVNSTDFADIEHYKPKNIITQTHSVKIPAGVYQPAQIADILTDDFSKTKDFIFDFDGETLEIDFKDISNQNTKRFFSLARNELADVNNTTDSVVIGQAPYQFDAIQYEDTSNSGSSWNLVIGACETEITYVDNKFKINAIHTPLFEDAPTSSDPEHNLSPVVNITTTAGTNNQTITKYNQASGIFLTKIESDDGGDILEQMGFGKSWQDQYTNIPNLNDMSKAINIEDFEKVITGGYNGNTNLLSTASGVPAVYYVDTGNAQKVQQIVAENTFGLISSTVSSDTDVSFFKVECIGGGLSNNMYFDPVNGRQSSMTAIVNRNYNELGFTNAYTESAVPYIHTGNQEYLTSVNVRILKPDTNKVFNNLGNNSTIFLQINRAEQKQKK